MADVNEVKKVLHICLDNESKCAGCVYREYEGGFCIDALMKDAFDLLEQQTAEIDKLKSGKEDNEE